VTQAGCTPGSSGTMARLPGLSSLEMIAIASLGLFFFFLSVAGTSTEEQTDNDENDP
jgi:hypothetical protein